MVLAVALTSALELPGLLAEKGAGLGRLSLML